MRWNWQAPYRSSRDADTDGRDANVGEHVEHRPTNASDIDRQLGARHLGKQSTNARDDRGVWCSEWYPLKVPDLIDPAHATSRSKSSASASSIISEENAELSASMKAPSNSYENSSGPSSRRCCAKKSAEIRGHSRPMILMRSISSPWLCASPKAARKRSQIAQSIRMHRRAWTFRRLPVSMAGGRAARAAAPGRPPGRSDR